jgi:hypothetical protein
MADPTRPQIKETTMTNSTLTIAHLQQLLTLAPRMTWEEIDQVETSILALPVAEALAKGFLRRRVTSRAGAAQEIGRRLSERKGRHERGEEIARIAAGGR